MEDLYTHIGPLGIILYLLGKDVIARLNGKKKAADSGFGNPGHQILEELKGIRDLLVDLRAEMKGSREDIARLSDDVRRSRRPTTK